MVIQNLLRNVEMSKKILKRAVAQIPKKRECQCATALKNAIITAPEVIPTALKQKLHLLIGGYVK
jgi:5'-methylthioadenosine phosphorylase